MRQPLWREPAFPYVAGFAVYVAMLAADCHIPVGAAWQFALRFFAVGAVLVLAARPVITLRPARTLSSILLGVAVFFLWVGPDSLWPQYRNHWLFTNSLMGAPASSIDPAVKTQTLAILFRVLSSVITVPILEELFWRGWLMRWLAAKDFAKVPLGQYSASSFWIVALLFASEHGSYWDVGLATGVVYNGWMIRTRSLADCILAHSVTNGCLALYVLRADQWQYWL